MKIGEYCKREVISIGPDANLGEAAKLMRERHVGFLVVASADSPSRRAPVGVITDRDIVVQAVAEGVDPATLAVRDVMSREPVIATESDDLDELMRGMQVAGIRRAPVIDARGGVVGVIAIDDALDVVTGLLNHMCGSIHNERRIERRVWRSG